MSKRPPPVPGRKPMAAALAGNVPPDVAAGLIQALGLIDTLEQSELLRREMAEYA